MFALHVVKFRVGIISRNFAQVKVAILHNICQVKVETKTIPKSIFSPKITQVNVSEKRTEYNEEKVKQHLKASTRKSKLGHKWLDQMDNKPKHKIQILQFKS